MSYSILYAAGPHDKYKPRKRSGRVSKILSAAMILAAVAALAVFRRPIGRALLPGDPEVTERAAEQLVESLKNGENMQDAVTAFCIEVLKDGLQDPV